MESNSNDKSKTHNSAHSANQHPKPSPSNLVSSAKVVADAAKAKMSNQEFDNAKAAGAAADILNAASHYGKLDESSGLGKVFDKAEDYLHKYNTSHATTSTATTHGPDGKTTTTTHEIVHTVSGHPGGKHGPSGGGGHGEYNNEAVHSSHAHPGGKHGHSSDHKPPATSKPGGGHSTSSHSDGGHGHSGSGYGEYMKKAGDFLKKH